LKVTYVGGKLGDKEAELSIVSVVEDGGSALLREPRASETHAVIVERVIESTCSSPPFAVAFALSCCNPVAS
jgi:hypothetical protein